MSGKRKFNLNYCSIRIQYSVVLLLFFIPVLVNSQVVYQHVSNKAIYEFVDELVTEQIIDFNTSIKPYTRKQIAQALEAAKDQGDLLTKRQKADLDFYLKDYNKELLPPKTYKKRFDLFYYQDSLFTVSLNPILGVQYWANENGDNYHRWNGLEAYSYIGKHLGIYASLRDNHETMKMADTAYLNMCYGANYKSAYDYSEMRGGITFNWNWGTFGVVKDHIEWGGGYTWTNIISAKAPSFAQIKLQLRPVEWFEFNYFHGWLVSEVVDSSRSYYFNDSYREVFYGKWMAANMFSVRPVKNTWVSFGNSIIYSDVNVHPAYLIPVFFYKSVDHTYNATSNAAGQNSQMFFDINTRIIKKINLYYTWFIDETSVSRMFDEERQSNHWSMKYGIKVYNLVSNIFLTLEYTRNRPLVYKNDNPTTFYNSNWYNLGHFLGDNSDHLYTGVTIKPLKGIRINLSYSKMRKGPEYDYDRSSDADGIVAHWGISFMESIEWSKTQYNLEFNYQFLNDMYVFAGYTNSSVSGDSRYTASFFQGETNTLSFGLNYGF